MEENMFDCSDTKLTASWETCFGGYYKCTNCGHTESHWYPARSIHLGRFCSDCGFRMTNPRFIPVEFDYE